MPTKSELGIVFHAGGPDGAVKALMLSTFSSGLEEQMEFESRVIAGRAYVHHVWSGSSRANSRRTRRQSSPKHEGRVWTRSVKPNMWWSSR